MPECAAAKNRPCVLLRTNVKVSIENFFKVGAMAILAIALARIASDRLNIPGLRDLVG